MEQRTLKIENNCLNTNIYSYLKSETYGGQSYNLYLNVFFGYAGSDCTMSAGVEISGLEGHWGGWTTVRRLAATVWRLARWFFCWRGSWTAWLSALGGDGVDDHLYWWPCGLSQRIWVNFLQKRRKILGSKNSHVFQCQIFAVEFSIWMLFIFSTPVLIRHLWQLKTVFFLRWCQICVVPLLWNVLRSWFMNVCNELECLSLVGFSNQRPMF